MNRSASSLERPATAARTEAGWLDRSARRAVWSQLASLEWGTVSLRDGDAHHVWGSQAEDQPRVEITIRNPGVYRRLAAHGSIGAGEAFMAGEWDVDDLTALVRIMVRNERTVGALERGAAWMAAWTQRALHWSRRNSLAGSRRNIAAHYDLGNEFYRLFLDETMMYSCALFETPQASLFEASTAKLERICRKLELSPADNVIEIGTGWGGFALHAASRFGCRVTTTTISRQQLEGARARVAAAGLSDRITIVEQDYRELRGSYDKLVSIEMIEAVGHEFLDAYFRACDRLLKPDGRMLLQAITIADQVYDTYRRGVDFIQRYIFPGGLLPSVTRLTESLTRATSLRLVHHEDWTPHYARTLAAWRERFLNRLDDVRRLGFDEPFIRMWLFYLGYCEGAFLERRTGLVQMVLAKPEDRSPPLLGSLP